MEEYLVLEFKFSRSLLRLDSRLSFSHFSLSRSVNVMPSRSLPCVLCVALVSHFTSLFVPSCALLFSLSPASGEMLPPRSIGRKNQSTAWDHFDKFPDPNSFIQS
ncbi:hypothetical protein JHK85_041002 [Glycine max]|nr:hypothetical protein JHK86_040417 [Glycine max]KAG4966027.1 hypothetical protein JHK85_041002 [Glycine max]